MPPVSQAQARFMRAVAAGDVKGSGLSRSQASEYVSGTPTKGLPQHVKRKRTAPLPAPGAARASVPAPSGSDGKQLHNATGQMFALNRLRGLRMKTTGMTT